MKTHVTIINSGTDLVKHYRIERGQVCKNTIHVSKLVWSTTEYVENIDEMFEILKRIARDPKKCVIRGKGRSESLFDVRRLTYSDSNPDGNYEDVGANWVAIDFDEKDVGDLDPRSLDAIEHLITAYLPEAFRDVSYVYQFSSSAGVTYQGEPVKSGANVHLFFYLDRPLMREELASWLPAARDFDTSVFKAVQPILTANECRFEGQGFEDSVPANQKLGFVEKTIDTVTAPSTEHFEQLHSLLKPASNQSVPENVACEILSQLNDIGAINGVGGNYVKLQHPLEKSKGDWFLYDNNPFVVHHHVKRSMHVARWCSKFWSFDIEVSKHDDDEVDDTDLIRQYVERNQQRHEQFKKDKKPIRISDLIELDESLDAPFDRKRRMDLMMKKFVNRAKKPVTVLYAFEGFGKSSGAVLDIEHRQSKVLFACHSNEQAAEQADSFRKRGIRTQWIPGRDVALMNKHQIAVEKIGERHPWDTGAIDPKQTIAKIQDKLKVSEEEAIKIFEDCEPPEPDWENHDCVVTTIARTQVWGKKQAARSYPIFSATGDAPIKRGLLDEDRIIPKRTTVFFDDPTPAMVARLFPYDERWEKSDAGGTITEPHKVLKIEGRIVKKCIINRREYFLRPRQFCLGYGLYDANLVFTTTELLTLNLLMTQFGLNEADIPTLMPENKMLAGDIKLIKTEFTRQKNDAWLMPICRRLQREGFDFELIADGIGSPHNLANSKGKNSFVDGDTIVKISCPPYQKVQHCIDELGWAENDKHAAKVLLALDDMNQAIGRNSGYRWSDREDKERRKCIVMCEPQLFNGLQQASRYAIQRTIDDVDAYSMRKRDYSELVDGLCWYLRNFRSYVVSGIDYDRNAFLNDLKAAVTELSDWNRVRFKIRLEKALKHWMKVSRSDQRLVEQLLKVLRVAYE